MDGKSFPYLTSSLILSNYYKVIIRESVKKEIEVLKEKLIEDLTREIYTKLKCELDSIRKDEWERIGSPDIK